MWKSLLALLVVASVIGCGSGGDGGTAGSGGSTGTSGGAPPLRRTGGSGYEPILIATPIPFRNAEVKKVKVTIGKKENAPAYVTMRAYVPSIANGVYTLQEAEQSVVKFGNATLDYKNKDEDEFEVTITANSGTIIWFTAQLTDQAGDPVVGINGALLKVKVP
jgi:hypothetical protein